MSARHKSNTIVCCDCVFYRFCPDLTLLAHDAHIVLVPSADNKWHADAKIAPFRASLVHLPPSVLMCLDACVRDLRVAFHVFQTTVSQISDLQD